MPRTRRRRWMPLLACALAVLLLPCLGRLRAESPAGGKYALLVGVHQYDKNELRDLPYAEADMEALADVLRKAGYQRVVLMTQSEGAKQARYLPEAAKIRATLKGMLEDMTADDGVLVAFAGHGVQYAGEDDNYFCPMDAKLADKTTLVSLSEVYKDLEQCGAGTRLLLADCCRNDPRSDNARAVDRVKLASVTRPQRALPPGGVAAFFSCSAGEKAYEDAGIKHGVFFHFVVEGLQGKADADGDGQVDLDELVGYTKRRVRDFVKDAYGDDVRQMPELVGKTHGQVTLATLGNPWKPLFNGKDLTGWSIVPVENDGNDKGWGVEEGVLVAHGADWKTRNFLLSDRDYSDFVLRLELSFDSGSFLSSGVGLRAIPGEKLPAYGRLIQDYPVVKIVSGGKPGKEETGTISWVLDGFDVKPDRSAEMQPAGSWNRLEIEVKGRTIRVSVNGKLILDATLASGALLSDGSIPALGRPKGRLGLQMHSGTVRFRNIEIKELSPATDKSDTGGAVKP